MLVSAASGFMWFVRKDTGTDAAPVASTQTHAATSSLSRAKRFRPPKGRRCAGTGGDGVGLRAAEPRRRELGRARPARSSQAAPGLFPGFPAAAPLEPHGSHCRLPEARGARPPGRAPMGIPWYGFAWTAHVFTACSALDVLVIVLYGVGPGHRAVGTWGPGAGGVGLDTRWVRSSPACHLIPTSHPSRSRPCTALSRDLSTLPAPPVPYRE